MALDVLLICDRLPDPRQSAGEHRLVELIKALCAAGHRLTFSSLHPPPRSPWEGLATLPVRWAAFPDVLKEQTDYHRFQVAILETYWIYLHAATAVRDAAPECALVLDTVDLHSLRFQREVKVQGGWRRRRWAKRTFRDERAALADADAVWFVSEDDRAHAGFEASRGNVVAGVHEPEPDPPSFDARHGIVFIGAYTHSPNVDAALYLLRCVLPHLRQRLPEISVTLAGTDPPREIVGLAGGQDHVAVTGFVEDHRDLLRSRRVGVAPLRFGAGLKGKVGEYLACGLPSAITPIAGEGLSLEHEKHVLIAKDDRDIADCLVRLHEDATLWRRLYAAGLAFCRERFTRSIFQEQLEAALSETMANRSGGGRREC